MAERKVDYLLIGGGLASANCARWLREEGAEGRCCWWGASPTLRTTARTARRGICRAKRAREEAYFRPDEWWGEQDIELLTRTSVTALDLDSRTAKLSNKEEVEFGKALIATGANVRRLNVRRDASSSRSTISARSATPTRSARAWRTPRRWC